MENTDVAAKSRRKIAGKIAAGGGVVMVGVLLATNFTGLAGWQQMKSGDSAVIQAGTLTSTLTPDYKVYDVSNINKSKNKEVDPKTFLISPGDTLYIVQGLDITAEGDNLAAQLKGGLKAMEGNLPLRSSLTLIKGEADPLKLVESDLIAFSEEGSLSEIPMDFEGTRHYQVISEVFFPPDSTDKSAINVQSVVGATTWTLKQVESTRS